MSDKLLAQEEIDALLKEHTKEKGVAENGTSGTASDANDFGNTAGTVVSSAEASGAAVSCTEDLETEEKDALGEIGNISFGSAATALSELLGHQVKITSPSVKVVSREEFLATFTIPYLAIEIKFKEGLKGFNLLVLKVRDAAVLADLMMGGEGKKSSEELTEIEISAASEAMNQMIGTASTSLSMIFGRAINISPPETIVLQSEDEVEQLKINEERLVVVSFRMSIEGFVETTIMQVMGVGTAKEEASLLLHGVSGEEEAAMAGTREEIEKASSVAVENADGEKSAAAQAGKAAAGASEDGKAAAGVGEGESAREYDHTHKASSEEAPAKETYRQSLQTGIERAAKGTGQTIPHPATVRLAEKMDREKLDLIMDIPLKVSVVLGRTRRPIKEVLNITSGSIVELSSLVDEPVEVLVNGTLVAKGEVVVVNENFGVRITEIISPAERLQKLGK